MKRSWFVILILLLSACSPAGQTLLPDTSAAGTPSPAGKTPSPRPTLINYGKAPELKNEVWLNTEHPLRLEDLRGKVVLLEMWTFG